MQFDNQQIDHQYPPPFIGPQNPSRCHPRRWRWPPCAAASRSPAASARVCHPGVELRANLESTSNRCHLFEVAFAWELTKETNHLPLGCLQGGRAGQGWFGGCCVSRISGMTRTPPWGFRIRNSSSEFRTCFQSLATMALVTSFSDAGCGSGGSRLVQGFQDSATQIF